MLIAGDIGGTKADLAIYSRESGPHTPLAQTQVHSADYPSLQAMVTGRHKGHHVLDGASGVQLSTPDCPLGLEFSGDSVGTNERAK